MNFFRIFAVVAPGALTAFTVAAEPALKIVSNPAPPADPPVITRADAGSAVGKLVSTAVNRYSIGDPTPEEQLYLEMINRSRANPVAEARFFATNTNPILLNEYSAWPVDLVLMEEQFALIPAAPPLAMSAKLTAAARAHTQDMFENVFQGHNGTDGSTAVERSAAQGYNFELLGENVFSYAHNVLHGHAGFDVDWGVGSLGMEGGMQVPPGHRNTIHEPAYREVGIGVLHGRKEAPERRTVGPQLVTQVFGVEQGATPFVTGVAYYDLNANSFYDPGEGIGGLTVTASGTAVEAITAESGGYALPVPGNGTYTITFSGNGVEPFSAAAPVGQANVKIDFVPSYPEPRVVGPATPGIARANSYSITPVPGASVYQWRVFQRTAAPLEGAETGTANFEIVQTPGYSVIQNAVKKSGTSAFQLLHPQGGVYSQYLNFRPEYLIGNNSSLTFQSRLGYAGTGQRAVVEVSVDEGIRWQTIYSQSGTNGAGESEFVQRTISLAPFAGKTLRLRFVYEYTSGTFFDQVDPAVGWVIDDIALSNAEILIAPQVNDTTADSFELRPETAGTLTLQARVKTGGHYFLPWGPPQTVTAAEATGTPEFYLRGIRRVASQLQIDLELIAGATPASFALESKDRLADNWFAASATVQQISVTEFRLVTSVPPRSSRFFRVRAN